MMILQSIIDYVTANPVETISYVITGATVASQLLNRVLPKAKWDNKLTRFLKEVADHVALDSNARYIKITFDDDEKKDK